MVSVRALVFAAATLALALSEIETAEPRAAKAAFPGENGKIAFANFGPGGNLPRVLTVNDDGSGLADLADGWWPSWSPDGQRIAYIHDGIWIMDADGQNQHQAVVAGGVNALHFSPDSTQFVYTASNGTQSSLVVVDTNGANQQILGSVSLQQGQYLSPSWSPDGSLISFSLGQQTEPFEFAYDIWVIKPDGTGLRQLTHFSPNGSAFYADWSPDGAELVVTRSQLSGSGLFAVDLNGNVTSITPTNGSPSSPAYSPDGQRIAYYLGPLTIVERDGSGQVSLPQGGISNYGLSWQPAYAYVDGVEFTQAIQELQTVPELLTDLKGDGEPPVAMVAGKAAAMRIYLGEVQQPTDYTVEVSGQFSDSEVVHLTAGCTPAQRRAQTGGCSSVDFFFTPPLGSWIVRLKVTEFPNAVVFDKEFKLTSVDMPELDVEYLPVCVTIPPAILPTCPTSFINSTGVEFARTLFPAADGDLHYSRFPVPPLLLSAPSATFPESEAVNTSLRLLYNLMALGNFAPDQVIGWLPKGGDLNYLGLADPVWLASTGRVSWATDQSVAVPDPVNTEFTLAHEIAHNYGARHAARADGCGATDPNTDWPYTDATIQEVGFNVATGQAVPATKKDLMSYCTPPGSNVWISPHTYNSLLLSDFVPTADGVHPESGAMQYLIATGSAQADGSSARIDSAYVITSDQPAAQPNPLGNYCLRATGGAQIDYCFMLTFQEHKSGAPTDSESFSIRMPLPPGTTHISLAKGLEELDALDVSASAPSLAIAAPDELNGEETISWSASDGDGDPLTYAVMYSPDDGAAWYPITADATDTAFTLDTSVLAGDEVLLRVLASDGLNTTIETTEPIAIVHGDPHIWGDNDCDGEISSRDNQALSRKVLQQPALSQTQPCPGLGDSVTIDSASHTWGDLDCDGEISSRDNQALLRKVLQQNALSQTQPCPAVGDEVTTTAAAIPGGWWRRFAALAW